MCSRHEAGANDSDVEVVCHAADAEPGKRTDLTDFADWSILGRGCGSLQLSKS